MRLRPQRDSMGIIMKKLLFQLDTDPIPNTFDTVVAYDGGAEHVTVHGGMTPDNVSKMVAGAIFTRPPAHKKFTALFVAGSDMEAGENLLRAIRRQFFGNFRVSVMLDSNGANTTAAAAVAHVRKHLDLAGKRAAILAGTGPVGQRAAVMLAQEGAEVVLTSRRLERAETACATMGKNFGVQLRAAAVDDDTSAAAALHGAHIVLATGAGGIQLLAEARWRDHPTLEFVMDANATPPAGIQGIEITDKGSIRHGKVCYGALGFGGLKLEVHRACIAKLFEANDQVFDAPEVYALARALIQSR